MAVLRALRAPDFDAPPASEPERPRANDWLSLQEAACELGVSVSTARRMIRKGRLRNRIVPRPGGYSYLVYMPGSRHAAMRDPHAPISISTRVAARDHTQVAPNAAHEATVESLEQQVEHLSEALSRALRLKQKQLPPGVGQPDVNPADPYERYRWLARRRRWWPFS